MTKIFLLLLITTGCLSYPITFPGQEGPGTSPMLGGVSCHSTGEHAMACTNWDGHHTINVCIGDGAALQFSVVGALSNGDHVIARPALM